VEALTEQYKKKEKNGNYEIFRIDIESEYAVIQCINHYSDKPNDPGWHESSIVKIPIQEFKDIIWRLNL